MEAVPESGVTESRAAGYKNSVYRDIQSHKKDSRIF